MSKLNQFLEVRQGEFENAVMGKLGLPKFETVQLVSERNEEMAARLETHGYSAEASGVAACGPELCGFGSCRDGCNRASRRRRIEMLQCAIPIFGEHSGPIYSVTIVHPNWELTSGNLADLNISAIRQWGARGLDSIQVSGLIALGIVEVSWNIEPDGNGHWAGEIQMVVAGATPKQLSKAFRDVPKRTPNAKPVMVSTVKHLPRKLAYVQKHFIERRTAFSSLVNGRQARRHMPPPWARWAEHDAWLLGLPLGARTLTFGLRRVGQRVFTRS